MRLLAALLSLAAALLPLRASAWTDAGHRIVGAIAEERLGPAARRLVREVIGDKALSDHDVAVWADDVRDRRTGPWHYVNLPRAADAYVAARDCTSAGCVVSAIDTAAAGLRDARDATALADSLRFLVHFVADLHQPMHAGELRDRGGNDTEVRLGKRRQPLNVHRLWDAEVVDPLLRGSDPLRVARSLAAAIAQADVTAWTSDLSPASWAGESHLLARGVYVELEAQPKDGRFMLLHASYPEAQLTRVTQALSKAGVRLAALLDRIAAEREARRPAR